MKPWLIDSAKNIRGWRTAEKFVVFSVDDYGNVCLNSRQARDSLVRQGVRLTKHIESVDALETREDLGLLFEVLQNVSDKHGRPAIFTANCLAANLDFSSISGRSRRYSYISLPDTFSLMSEAQPTAYAGVWEVWKSGMRAGLIRPQFHGREHLNVDILEQKLRVSDRVMALNVENQSLVGLDGDPSLPGVGFTEAFGVCGRSDIERHRKILTDGLSLFESIFGFRSRTFAPPKMTLHPELYTHVESLGVAGIDKPFHCLRRLDKNQSVREWNVLGRQRGQGHVSLVRNVVFEPTKNENIDSMAAALRQIAVAFRWNKPAIISSHRANFSGHINPINRKRGLASLKRLLDGIVQRWPDVQFVSADELVDRILASE